MSTSGEKTMEVRWGSTAAFFFFFGRDVSRETAKVRSDAVDSSADAADLNISKFFVSLGT